MNLYSNDLYCEDVRFVADIELHWEELEDRSIMISGATGLIGSFLADVLMKKNEDGLNVKVYALGRNEDKFSGRFSKYQDNSNLIYVKYDVNEPLEMDVESVDYILHLASNTHPLMYSTDPIGTITTNII